MNAFSTIISTYLVLYILGSMYIDLAHTGDEPCKCTGCDKGFINELYKWDTSYQFRFSIFILVFLSLDFINELYIMHIITHILDRQVVLKDTSVSTLERSHINVIFAISNLHTKMFLCILGGYTRVKYFINVICVINSLLLKVILPGIGGSTP